MRLKSFFVLGFLALVVSCAQYETPTAPTTVKADRGNRVPVRFHNNSNISISTTRATGESFDMNDAIGIFVVNRGETKTDTLMDSGNYVDNLEYVCTGAGFEPVADSIWQYDKMSLDLVYYAIYPYNASQKPRFTFSARADQSNHTDYTMSDLACQKKESKERDVNLELKHMMSKIVVRLQGDNIDISNISVTLNDMRLNADVDLNTMEVSATGNASPSIKCEENTALRTPTERVFQAIIAPQILTTVSGLTIWTGTESKSISLPRACRLASGKQWTLSYEVDIDEGGDIFVNFGGDEEEGGQHVD
jgi:hypothetical protein